MINEYLKELIINKTLCNEVLRVSKLTQGKSVETWREEYGSYIFGKIACHAITIHKLLPHSDYYNLLGNFYVSDINSISTLVRALIDSYYVFYYLIIDQISREESEFRQLIWHYHENNKRIKLLSYCKKIDNQKTLAELEIEAKELKTDLINSEYLKTLKSSTNYQTDKAFKIKIDDCLKGKISIFIDNGTLSEKIGINKNFYKGTFQYLSQYVHCYPFAVSQIAEYSKSEKSYQIEICFLNDLNCYLALAIRDFNRFYDIDYTDDIKIIIENCEFLMKNY